MVLMKYIQTEIVRSQILAVALTDAVDDIAVRVVLEESERSELGAVEGYAVIEELEQAAFVCNTLPVVDKTLTLGAGVRGRFHCCNALVFLC